MNGKTYKAKTNANGVASVNVSISKAGSYAVTAKYAGDSTFAATTAKATLNISKNKNYFMKIYSEKLLIFNFYFFNIY